MKFRWLNGETLGQTYNPNLNSIGAIRLACALAVIIGHAHPFAGYGDTFLMRLTNQQISGARVSVDVFFVLSGFLLTASWERLSLRAYFRNRILRIFPGLWICLLITGVVVPMLFGVSPGWQYVLQNAVLLGGTHNFIPGLFQENIFRGANSALWTLPWEVYCYISLPFLALGGTRKKQFALLIFFILWAAFCANIVATTDISDKRAITSPLRLFTFFYAGVLLHLFRDSIPCLRTLAIVMAGLLALGTAVGTVAFPHAGGIFYIIAPIAVSYLTLYCAATLPLTAVNARHDISYGLYIYGTYSIQVLIALGFSSQSLSYPAFVTLCLLVAVPISWLSWHLVEAPALKLKQITFAKSSRTGASKQGTSMN